MRRHIVMAIWSTSVLVPSIVDLFYPLGAAQAAIRGYTVVVFTLFGGLKAALDYFDQWSIDHWNGEERRANTEERRIHE